VTKPKVTVFTMPQCPKCPAAKELVKQVGESLDIDIEEVDIKEDMVKGLQFGVASTPSVAVNEKLISRGEVPDREELIAQIKRAIG